jgi:starch synthase
LPLYLRRWYGWDGMFARTRTLLSIHNIGYQGVFPAETVDRLGLAEARGDFHQGHLAEGHLSFLETGVIHASWLSTVSETYAREIQTAEYGMGLEGLLSARADHLVGIVNGVDHQEWDPESDPLIPHHFTASDLDGKRACRDALLAEFDLAPVEPGRRGHTPPVIGIVSRMTAQKGFELLPDILPVFLKRADLRLVVLGSGEERHERYFQWLRDTFPDRVACYLGYQNELAHRIEAGADLFLVSTISAESSTIVTRIGPSHHFLRTRMKAQSSENSDIMFGVSANPARTARASRTPRPARAARPSGGSDSRARARPCSYA